MSHSPPFLRCTRLRCARSILGDARGIRWGLLGILAILVAGLLATPVEASEADRIAEAMALAPGRKVADVGAGDGQWTVHLARRVGEEGHVWATEVDADDLEELRQRVEREGLTHVTPVLGDAWNNGLPDDCCDAILLRLVYHHFTFPARMRSELHRALKPQGLLVVVEITPQEQWRKLPDVPDRGGYPHGITVEDLLAELTSDGFRVVERYDDWYGDEDRYCVVFQEGGAPPAAR